MQNWFLSVFIAAQRKREKGDKGKGSASTYQEKQRFQFAAIQKTAIAGNIRIDIWLNRNRHIVITKRERLGSEYKCDRCA